MIGQGHYVLLGASRKGQYCYVLFHDELIFSGNVALRMRLEVKLSLDLESHNLLG